ncbi:uncharacterized protein At3g06530-like [Macadamia integrifolia]|uniref:uncharacterized protein At3g06530-like n=1 Tax=Macadamia integrifolia TaxID=60698 RepID=UPI001C4FB6AC|nr:uncharacterized protein At3g06530-like [Macadamia integrifolia]
MIVGLLASKAMLSPELIKNLIVSIAVVAREDAKESADLAWLRMSLMAIINIVQVLMQTRSDKIRSRILGLKIVKYLLDHLKEEYLVLLPETIPFLGELLEDVESSVKSLAQEILKDMEALSGESLRQYL